MKAYTAPVSCMEFGHLIVNREYLDILESCGLKDYDLIFQYATGDVVKQTRQRSVTRVEISSNGEKRYFYFKRHKMAYLRFRELLYRLLGERRCSQGRREFENICDFRKSGIPTVRPVAAGERSAGLFREESVLITEAFDPFVSLEKIIKNRPEFLQGPNGEKRKMILLEEIARLARHMHQSGFNHQDFNATHLLLYYENESDVPALALFDLQRVDRRKIFRFKWFIKTLAELNYTLPDTLFNAELRLHLFHSYKGKTRLNLWDRFQIYWIERKKARIGRHTEKIMKKRAEKRRLGLPER